MNRNPKCSNTALVVQLFNHLAVYQAKCIPWTFITRLYFLSLTTFTDDGRFFIYFFSFTHLAVRRRSLQLVSALLFVKSGPGSWPVRRSLLLLTIGIHHPSHHSINHCAFSLVEVSGQLPENFSKLLVVFLQSYIPVVIEVLVDSKHFYTSASFSMPVLFIRT